MSKKFNIIGKHQPQLDAWERVSGKAKYASDLYLPGMLYAKILRSPHPHAKIINIDVEKAKALLGVKAILTPKDMPPYRWHADMPILTDTARFEGDDIAVVAAVDEDVAREALDLIKVDYQALPFVLDPQQAMKPEAPKIHPQGNIIGGKPLLFQRGDIEKGFQESDLVYEDNYRTSLLQHATSEPRVCVALWEGGKLTLWDSTQYTFSTQAGLSRALKIPMSKVRVICEFMGGGFGDKTGPERYNVLAALLTKKTGRPVKIEFDRDENFLAAHHRYPTIWHLKYGVKKDGTLIALYAKVIADMGGYGHFAGAGGSLETMRSVYRCPNLKAEGYSVHTNKPEGGFLRCVGHPMGQFAQEVHMDIIAEKLGMDPVEFRLKNHARLEDGDQDRKLPFTSNGVEECIRRGAEEIGWRQKWQKPGSSSGPKKRGIGMAIHACRHGAMTVPSSGMVRINSDGTVNVLTGTSDIGGGQKGAMAMIAAEELGVPLEAVSVTSADTDVTTDTGGSTGSRQIMTGGTGIRLAAADARRQILEIAARELKTAKENLEIRGGQIYVQGSDKGIPLGEALRSAPASIIGRGIGQLPKGFIIHTFAAHFVEVEIDTRTGKVKVLKLFAVHDVGKAINMLAVENQIEGGAIQGMGFGLMEDQILDRTTGICVNPNVLDYKMFTIKDVPEIYPLVIEPYDPHGPFGAKGVGEPPYSVPAPAIANAIYNAIGVRFKEIPITPRSILEGLKGLKA
ncbi:MAG: xanthine dehydrogenase family protein molybdopterin-binding subunit [Thermodesulfobacteriota bacterium]|nr:xanthine dehydrogenase family protein molybdopterin-binding subunit [Thermodesulfobacteriota bacterium]